MLPLSLILAHLIADFYLQTDEMVSNKLKHIKKHIFHHTIVTGIVLFAALIYHLEKIDLVSDLISPLIIISASHFFIDLLKIQLLDRLKINKEENLKRLGFFLLDQALHLCMIILSCYLFFQQELMEMIRIIEADQELTTSNSLLVILIIVILATNVSGHLVKILVGSLPNHLLTFEGKYSFKNERQADQVYKNSLTEEYNYSTFSKQDLSRGKIIGYIERLLVLLLTFYSAYPAIGFIVAAKSIARFKQMDDRDWAEYFLLGTLTSMFLGITLGIVLREVLT
jgi:hypothetical protein